MYKNDESFLKLTISRGSEKHAPDWQEKRLPAERQAPKT